MGALTEKEIRDRTMHYTGVATTALTPVGDNLDPTLGVPTRFFINKRRHFCGLVASSKTGAVCKLDLVFNGIVVYSIDLPANTGLPTVIPVNYDNPFLSIIGIPDEPLNTLCSVANGADVNLIFFDEP